MVALSHTHTHTTVRPTLLDSEVAFRSGGEPLSLPPSLPLSFCSQSFFLAPLFERGRRRAGPTAFTHLVVSTSPLPTSYEMRKERSSLLLQRVCGGKERKWGGGDCRDKHSSSSSFPSGGGGGAQSKYRSHSLSPNNNVEREEVKF